jgi:uncharacterized Zn finger protein
MWRCTSCAETNDDALSHCKKCKKGRPAVSADDTSLDGVVDLDRPVPVSEASTVQCPTCGEVFKVQGAQAGHSSRIYRRLDAALCPSCSRQISPESLVRVAAKQREGAQVKEVILACPYCGKVVGVIN